MSVPEVDATTGHQRVLDGALLIDVRNDDEWAAGHAPDAVLIVLNSLPTRVSELATDRPIVAICRTGVRSARATEWLNMRGYDAVNLAGGMQAWEAAGLSIVTDDGAPGAVI